MNMNKKVLITDGVARQILPMAKGFKKLGCDVTVICFSKLDVGFQTKYTDHRILLKGKEIDLQYQENAVLEFIKYGNYDLVIPMSDETAAYLAKNKKSLSQYAYIAVNDLEVFKLAIDKLKTMDVCTKNDIGAPRTLFSENPINDIDNSGLKYPIVIKPRTAYGSIGFNIVKDKIKMEKIMRRYNSAYGPLFVQEYIPQNTSQFGAEVYRDRNGHYASLLINEKPRWFPLDGGSPTINVTVHNEKMAQMSRELLDAMNWHGYANIDFVVDCRDNQPKILEVNARISAAVKLNFCVGIDIARLIYEDAFESDITHYKDYPNDMKVSCFLTEFLWFIKSKDRFHTKIPVVLKKNNRDVVFSWDDIRPFFSFCIQSALRYKKSMRLRKRS